MLVKMLAEETTVPEDSNDVFGRLSVPKETLMLQFTESFFRSDRNLCHQMCITFERAELTQHNGEETYHFVFRAMKAKDSPSVRKMISPVCAEMAERLQHQVAISVLMPKRYT